MLLADTVADLVYDTVTDALFEFERDDDVESDSDGVIDTEALTVTVIVSVEDDVSDPLGATLGDAESEGVTLSLEL